jgi:hypothetical protein
VTVRSWLRRGAGGRSGRGGPGAPPPPPPPPPPPLGCHRPRSVAGGGRAFGACCCAGSSAALPRPPADRHTRPIAGLPPLRESLRVGGAYPWVRWARVSVQLRGVVRPGRVVRPRRVVRFARLMHRRVRALGSAFGRRRLRRQSQPGLVATQRDPRTDKWPLEPIRCAQATSPETWQRDAPSTERSPWPGASSWRVDGEVTPWQPTASRRRDP